MTKDQIDVIERLRAAAQQHGEVANVLSVLKKSLLIDEVGNREIIADATQCDYLQAAMMAADFAEYDRSKEMGGD
jgi:hypothetical protein